MISMDNEKNILFKIIKSWFTKESEINNNREILDWINKRNAELNVQIKQCNLSDSSFWFYDNITGTIKNKNNSFFYIIGLQETGFYNNKIMNIEQPVIVQNEIGYLGIICKEFDGVIHFLMQAKIEPGNINKVQISPTIQATKSNFTQKHGGNKPAYIDYFIEADRHTIIVDQIQSEQSSRFYKKRNRNIIIYVEEDIEVLPSHKWMTLGQIKSLMTIDNLVNMDTRTVLSCIPFYTLEITAKEKEDLRKLFYDKSLFTSIFNNDEIELHKIYNKINNYKMFFDIKSEFVKLTDLQNWVISDKEIKCIHPYPYKVIYCNIAIECREVKEWTQPLFAAEGKALFGLFIRENNGKKEFLVKITHEIGCFDIVELAPTVQSEAIHLEPLDNIENLFNEKLKNNDGVLFDHYLSEEGGRFYHEENRNVLISLDSDEIDCLPKEYMWLDFKTLNYLVQFNNVLNIQLRNLLSLL